MDLTSDHPYWLLKNGLTQIYPPLAQDISTEITVIGAGITGALVADRLASEGHQVVVIDGRDVCTGSTSASTALLQYEIDVSLIDMADIIGFDKAQRAYKLSWDSIDKIKEIASTLDSDFGFRSRKSLYINWNREQDEKIQKEVDTRNSIGLTCQFLDQNQFKDLTGLSDATAIISDQAASCDPYLFAHALLQRAKSNGAQIYDRTKFQMLNKKSSQSIQLKTDRGFSINTQQIIFATGYESQNLLHEKVVKLKNTYALVTAPLSVHNFWNPDWIMWEAKTPYNYLRLTDDNRILIGGEDDENHNPTARDKRLPQKVEKLEQKLNFLFPDLNYETEFAWAGTFGETKDGLAYIGSTPEFPGCFFALGFGGNGITFSSIAADLLSTLVLGKQHPDQELFKFGR